MSGKRNIAGQVIAVTGGAQGIGRAIAAELMRRGARVAIGDVNLDAARRTASELGSETMGAGVLALPLDVTDTASFALFLDAAEHHLGEIDVLVNNAGVMWLGAFDEEPERIVQRQLDVNLHGTIRGVKLAAPRMRARGHGQIVTVASAASKVAPAGQATYAATKHGLYGYLSSVRLELEGSGVDISLVMPGTVETQLTTGMNTGTTRWVKPEQVAQVVADLIERPRFEVAYPAWIGLAANLGNLLPDRLRLTAQRLTLPNQVNAKRDTPKRADYEAEAFKGEG